MVRWWVLAIGMISVAIAGGVDASSSVDITALAMSWPPSFILTGTKTEPTYIEHIRLERDGDLFTLQGGAPAGMPSSRESLVVEPDGALRHIECPPGMRCDIVEPPSGFLAAAAIVSAIRNGRLTVRLPVSPYERFLLACVPAESLDIHDAILDPCIEIHSGAVMALRHRLSGQFDGPSLDPWSIGLSTFPSPSVSTNKR
jgi:hypothetical protein